MSFFPLHTFFCYRIFLQARFPFLPADISRFFWYNARFISLHRLKPRRSLSSIGRDEYKQIIQMATTKMIILLAIGLASRVAAHGFMRTASADGETWAEPNWFFQSILLTISAANAIIQIITRIQHALRVYRRIRTMAILITMDTDQGTSSVTKAQLLAT